MSRNRMYAFTDNDLMPFGMHKNKRLADVPAYYLIHIYKNMSLYGGLKEYLERNMEAIKKREITER